jgi:hypothetical protein
MLTKHGWAKAMQTIVSRGQRLQKHSWAKAAKMICDHVMMGGLRSSHHVMIQYVVTFSFFSFGPAMLFQSLFSIVFFGFGPTIFVQQLPHIVFVVRLFYQLPCKHS